LIVLVAKLRTHRSDVTPLSLVSFTFFPALRCNSTEQGAELVEIEPDHAEGDGQPEPEHDIGPRLDLLAVTTSISTWPE